eukprot:scaffold281325_cov32-Tisochrysis_lutea.AAC.2
MRVALYYEPSASHAPSERDRKKMIELAERVSGAHHLLLQRGLVQRCEAVEPRGASDEELLRVHRPEHLAQVRERSLEPRAANGHIYYSNAADRAARLACGAVIDAAARAFEGGPLRAFVLARPPGHHAGRNGFEGDFAEGGCFYNSVAAAAAAARARGVGRVAILDWDVHHGNGTQEIFYDDPSVLYISMHGNLYPGTGSADEMGEAGSAALGRTVNIMWPDPLRYPPAADAEYLTAVRLLVIPILRAFDPQLLLISAGFDAAQGEAFRFSIAPDTFARMTAEIANAIQPSVPLIAALEGGYNPASVGECCAAVLRVLLGDQLPAPQPLAPLNPKCEKALLTAVRMQEAVWAPHVTEATVMDQLKAQRELAEHDVERTKDWTDRERKRVRR